MAFSDLKPVCASDENGGNTYIIGSVFAVYGMIGAEPPTVYSWDMIKTVSVTRRQMVIETAGKSYTITNNMFANTEEVLRAIAIIECRQKEYSFGYQHEKRMFPLKSMYTECSPGKDCYTGEGILDDGETAAAFIMLLNFKLVKFLWLIALLIMFVTFGILHLLIGITRDNVLYFVPISIASGAIVALLVHMITHAAARAKFRKMADADLATREPITFVVSRVGFAACESCTYEGRDLIPWSEMDYFIESDKMFILYKNNAAAAYILKRAFEKKYVGGIADIIAVSLEQR